MSRMNRLTEEIQSFEQDSEKQDYPSLQFGIGQIFPQHETNIQEVEEKIEHDLAPAIQEQESEVQEQAQERNEQPKKKAHQRKKKSRHRRSSQNSLLQDSPEKDIVFQMQSAHLEEEKKQNTNNFRQKRRNSRSERRQEQQKEEHRNLTQQDEVKSENEEEPQQMSPPHTQNIFMSEQSDDEYVANINETPRQRNQPQCSPVSCLNTCEDLDYATLATITYAQQSQTQNLSNNSSFFDQRSPRTIQLIKMYKPKYL